MIQYTFLQLIIELMFVRFTYLEINHSNMSEIDNNL